MVQKYYQQIPKFDILMSSRFEGIHVRLSQTKHPFRRSHKLNSLHRAHYQESNNLINRTR